MRQLQPWQGGFLATKLYERDGKEALERAKEQFRREVAHVEFYKELVEERGYGGMSAVRSGLQLAYFGILTSLLRETTIVA